MLNLRLALLAAAVVAPAAVAAGWQAHRRGLDRQLGADVAWWGLVGFLLAARLVWLALNPAALRYPVDAIRLTQGLVTAAGVAGGVLAVSLLRRVRYRSVAWPPVAHLAAVAAAAGMAGWYGACSLQQRCGGRLVTAPLGVALEVGAPQVPVGPLAAGAALGVLVWLWRVGRPSLRRSLAAGGLLVLATAAAGALALRAAGWPHPPDLALIGLGAGLLGAAARVGCD